MRENGLTPEERWRIADLERRIEEDDDVDAMVERALETKETVLIGEQN